MLDPLVKDTDLPVSITAPDGGLSVGQAVVVVHLDTVPVGSKNCGLTLKLVILKKSCGLTHVDMITTSV
jgi:hypothetical protein